MVLLDLVENKMRFAARPYKDLTEVAVRFGLEVKDLADVLWTPQELMDWYSKVKRYDFRCRGYDGDAHGNADGDADAGWKVEGFVIEDADGFHAKVKGDWYSYWKFFRGVAKDISRKGRSAKINAEYMADMPGSAKGRGVCLPQRAPGSATGHGEPRR